MLCASRACLDVLAPQSIYMKKVTWLSVVLAGHDRKQWLKQGMIEVQRIAVSMSCDHASSPKMGRGRKPLATRAQEAAIRIGDKECPSCHRYFSIRGGGFTRHSEQCQVRLAHKAEIEELQSELQALRTGESNQ
jgi:hypothetical protein